MRTALMSFVALAALMPAFAASAPRTVRLVPGTATLALRAYAMGLLPINSHFTHFDGALTYDPAVPGGCSARLTAFTDSLENSNPVMRETILGPEFLDAAHFPTLTFSGTCSTAEAVAGTLSVRGFTNPLAMRLTWTAHGVTAEGEMRRALWGMDARPFTVGPTIRLTVSVVLP